ncbi:MAG TPA: aspartate kinase, partial [Cyclobacteriaceae bacterium]|nr:aspartate kinase [Cyclobacteriaceae bacterium]
YTAAIFAGGLQVSALEIWTDVDGMMTADPRLVKKAFTIPTMSYEEAMELSHFGAKVIFPSTLLPAMAHNIPIWVKNTFQPEITGTLISAESTNGKPIKGISSMNNISLLNIQGSGMLGVVGVSMRLFSTLAQEKINVILISQASSEHSICIAIESTSTAKARVALKKEFQHEIVSELIDDVHVTENLSIVATVGDGMKHHPGTSGRMFSALGKNGINIVAIAQGSSERNISVVIGQNDVAKALNALHDTFFLSDRKTVHVFLAGTGLIGKALLHQVTKQFKQLSEENKLEVRITGMANSKKMMFAEEGLSFTNGVQHLNENGEPMNLELYHQKMTALNLPSSVFVDCTSSEDVAACYASILDANIAIVTPNKKANSGALETYKQLKRIARQRDVRFL